MEEIMYIVIAGCGRLGAQLASIAAKDKHDVAVVSRTVDDFKRLTDNFNGITLEGIEFDIDTLKSAGIEQAGAFAAVTSDDNTNIMAAQVARNVFKVPIVVARVFDPLKEKTFNALGIDSICPTTLGAASIYSKFVIKDKSSHFLFYNDKVELIEVIYKNKKVLNKVKELEALGNFKIVTIGHDRETLIAKGDMILHEGDNLLIAVITENFEDIKKVFDL
jgi:trk system potassium uptake protein TrkA